jgi:chromosome segregation ATPase
MGFMQRDIDFKLILLILVVIIAIVGLTIFYQSSAGNIIHKYNKVTEKLEVTQENLTVTQVELDACLGDIGNLSVELDGALDYQSEAQDEFNSIYGEQEEELASTSSKLSNAEDKLEDAKANLEQAESDLEVCQETRAEYEDAADKADNYAQNVESTLDGCKSCADTTSCQSCIASALGDINTVRNYLDEIES